MTYDNTQTLNSARQRENEAKAETKQRRMETKAINKAANAEKKKSREAARTKKASDKLEKAKDEAAIYDFARQVDYRGKIALFNDRPNDPITEAQQREFDAKEEAKKSRDETKAINKAIHAERRSRCASARSNRANKKLEMERKHTMISQYADRIGYEGHLLFADFNERPNCASCNCARKPKKQLPKRDSKGRFVKKK